MSCLLCNDRGYYTAGWTYFHSGTHPQCTTLVCPICETDEDLITAIEERLIPPGYKSPLEFKQRRA